MTETRAKIFLVDDHPLVREWLTNLIQQNSDLIVCGEAEDVPTALTGIAEIQPDLAIIDLSLGGGSGIELIRSIRKLFPKVAMIVLSMHDERTYAERSMRAGARGYIMKRESTKKIVNAIREVLKGNMYVSDELTALFAKKFVSGPSPTNGLPIAQLSDRELDVFRLLGEGHEPREIAEVLNVNVKTVHTYCTRIKEKMKFSTGAELQREAIRWSNDQF